MKCYFTFVYVKFFIYHQQIYIEINVMFILVKISKMFTFNCDIMVHFTQYIIFHLCLKRNKVNRLRNKNVLDVYYEKLYFFYLIGNTEFMILLTDISPPSIFHIPADHEPDKQLTDWLKEQGADADTIDKVEYLLAFERPSVASSPTSVSTIAAQCYV